MVVVGGATFAGVALAAEAHHEGGAVGALGGAGEGLDAQLVRFGLNTHTHTTQGGQFVVTHTHTVVTSPGDAHLWRGQR